MNKMETKEVKIEVPEGYEIDKRNSTFEKIVFKKKVVKTEYKDVCKTCKYDGWIGFKEINKNILNTEVTATSYHTKEQAIKLAAINRLMNVAKYLNGDWKPKTIGYSFKIVRGKIVYYVIDAGFMEVQFKDEQTIRMALDILGEDIIRQALSNDY